MRSVLAISDEASLQDLLSQVASGDSRAFNILYGRTHSKMLRVALLILRDRAAAEDAVQEAYLSIWRRALTYRSLSGFSAISWMAAVVRNKSIDSFRARQPAGESVPDDLRDLGLDPEEVTMRAQQTQRVERLLGQLDDKKRPAVVGAYVEGASYEALAARLMLPLNTLRTRLRRGLQDLGDLARQEAEAENMRYAAAGRAARTAAPRRSLEPATV